MRMPKQKHLTSSQDSDRDTNARERFVAQRIYLLCIATRFRLLRDSDCYVLSAAATISFASF